jgi:hypothetical protein
MAEMEGFSIVPFRQVMVIPTVPIPGDGHGELTEPLYTSDGQLALIPVIRFSWNPGQ